MLSRETTYQHDASNAPSGPFLLFRGTHQSCNVYSILIVFPPSMVQWRPTLHLSTGTLLNTEQLDAAFNFSFWRMTIQISLTWEQQAVTYAVDNLPSHTFFVPAIEQHWRFSFFSCNGLSADIAVERKIKYNGIQPLWVGMLKEHQTQPLHLLIGGGDQLYFDPLFEVVPGLNAWAHMSSKSQRKSAPFHTEMERGVAWFYMNHYLHGFMDGAFATALASIPYCMSWDDHDIFDGWGSYPEYLLASNVFQGIFQSALRFYLLFQHHTTPERARQDGYVGHPGFHKVLQCGPALAVALPDTRTERTLQEIVTPASWDALFHTLETQLLPTTRHLLFVAPVPMTYPHSTAAPIVSMLGTSARAVSAAVHSIGRMFNERCNLDSALVSTQAYKSAVNRFGEPELLDDLSDHWNHATHVQEKMACVQRLQTLARERHLRVTLLSGDVHLAAVGLAYASQNRHDPVQFLPWDPCGMYQIVSSGIGNLPPPPLVASGLARNLTEMKLDTNTQEKMLDLFRIAAHGDENPTPCFLRRRNWTLGQLRDREMAVWICAEIVKGDMEGDTRRYLVSIPDLQLKG